MPNTDRTEPVRGTRFPWGAVLYATLLVALLSAASVCQVRTVAAHEGHDHDKPAPLSLPVAPRVVAVTPDYELVGVLSGEHRLTIFLHRFDTGEPVKDAKLSVSAGEHQAEAVAREDGVFEVSAPWIKAAEPADIVFRLTLPNDQDILTGRLEKTSPAGPLTGLPAGTSQLQQTIYVAIGATMAGVLLTLLVGASLSRQRHAPSAADRQMRADAEAETEAEAKVKQLRRAPVAVLALLSLVSLTGKHSHAQTAPNLPSIPATMATDVPQRMPDSSLFVPKATQHLLSVRTVLAKETTAPGAVQLAGTVIADPNSFGRVQSGHAGRIEAPEGGLAFVGKRVQKGDLLAQLQHHIEAYNKGNLQGEIAELEERIKLQEAKLARYLQAPLAVPPIKIDEAKGEIQALRQKRKELVPTLVEREEIRAPISGVISAANVVAGQAVDAREVIFEIVDPARFWVEAIAHDPGVVANIKNAFAIASTAETIPLEFAGLGLTLKQQAAPLTFRVAQASPSLSIGKPVTVILQSTIELTGIVLPASSVVRSRSGLPTVWVKTEPERFEPHTVRFEPLDGQRVVVLAGLKADLRVVTEGATLLNQIR
jgi:cobalt-zinc-cadmium efflux system membrane fusion protein